MSVRDIINGLAPYRRLLLFSLACCMSIGILMWPRHQPDTANRGFAVLVFVVIMWSSNSMPPFATALAIPLLVIGLDVMRTPEGGQLPPPVAGAKMLSAMVGSTIPVLLASFSVAACYRRYHMPFLIDNVVIDKFSHRPVLLVLVLMSIALVLCMIVDNMSAIMIGFTLISGRLKNRLIDPRLSKALLISLVVAGNAGGSLTPVSSAQAVFSYALAQKSLGITWLDWVRVSIPCNVVILLVGWAVIVFTYGLRHVKVEQANIEDPETKQEPEQERAPTWKIVVIIATTILTVILWVTSRMTTPVLGGMGIIAFIPIVILYGLEILSVRELTLIPWDVILLMMGALALVEALQSSGLPHTMSGNLKRVLSGLGIRAQIAAVGFIILLTSTIKSHTIAGLVFAPVVLSYIQGSGMPVADGHALFQIAVMATSIGMALPFSGLVNQVMTCITDGDGNRILGFKDYLKVGGIVSIVAYVTLVTLGVALLT